MFSARRLLVMSIVLTVTTVAAGLCITRQRQIVSDGEIVQKARRRIAELAELKQQVEDFQRRKAEYEARVRVVERFRGQPGPYGFGDLVARAQAAGLPIESLRVSEQKLTLVFRASSRAAARGFGEDLERAGLVSAAFVTDGASQYRLTAMLVSRPEQP